MSHEASRAASIEVGELIDQRGLGPLQIRVLVFCALVTLLDGYDLQVMALAVPSVAETWGVAPTSFAWALTASVIGLAIGGAGVTPIADRIGRRPLLILGMAVTGLATLATATAQSVEAFVLWRLLTGVGIGICQPVSITLTAEYMPQAKRAWLVTLMACNVAFGGFLAGFLAGPLMEHFTWRGLFLFGGITPLVMAAALWIGLPESLRLLVARKPGHKAIAAILASIAPGVDPASLYVEARSAAKRTVLDLMGAELRNRTLLLWLIYALNIFIIYLLLSWLPTLLTQAGWPRGQASLGAVMIQGGGVVGGLLLSGQVDRGRTIAAMLLGYAVFAVSLGLLVVTPSSFWTWSALIFAMGAGISGSQFILISLAALFYPLGIRATGVGWAGVASRAGAISAPLFGGWAIQNAEGPVQVMAMMFVPVALCALLALLIRKEWVVN